MAKQLVIVGAGQGGLSAAVYARLAGWDVLVLEQADDVGGKARQIHDSGFRFDPGPSIVILTEIYDRVFQAAGRRREDYLQFQRLPVLSRVYMGDDSPIDLPANAEQCVDLIRALAPNDADKVQQLLDTLDEVAPGIERTIFAHSFDKPWQLANLDLVKFATKFPVQLTYKEIVDQWFASPLLRAFFYGFPSYGGQSYHAKSPGGFMIPYYMLRTGVWWPVGGIGSIPRAFASLAIELGVEIRTGARITSWQHASGRIKSVTLESGETIDADAFISNIDRATVRQQISADPVLAPSYSYFTVHWGIDAKVNGLDHHTLVIPKDFEAGFESLYGKKQFPAEPIVYLNHCAPIDPSCAPPGATDLFAVVTSPALEPHINWAAESPDFEARVRKQLTRVGITWRDEDVRVKRIQTPATFLERDGNAGGSLYGPDEAHRLWGLMPQSNRDPDYRNLSYVGGGVQPGAGLPMVTLGGKFAVAALTSSGNRPTSSS